MLQDSFSFELEVACLDRPNAAWLDQIPATVHALGPGVLNYGFSPRFADWVKANCHRFDVVVINGLWQFSSYGTWLALQGTTTPYIVFPHGMLDPWFNQRYPLKHLKKQVFWLLFEYFVLADAKAVMFTSEQEKISAATSFAPYEAQSVVIPYGTLPPPAAPSSLKKSFLEKNPEYVGTRLLVYLGRLHPKKGLDLLIEAVNTISSQFGDLRLLIVGPGEELYKAKLEASVKDRSVVTFRNMASGMEKWELLSAAQALILPSHQENFARVVSEALSCHVPVLLSDKVNIWPAIVNDGAGFAAPDTQEGMRILLLKFISLPDSLEQSMRVRALQCFTKRFDLSRNFSTYLSAVESAVKVSV